MRAQAFLTLRPWKIRYPGAESRRPDEELAGYSDGNGAQGPQTFFHNMAESSEFIRPNDIIIKKLTTVRPKVLEEFASFHIASLIS